MAGAASALTYAESEGPTKVDFGEDDHNVLPREAGASPDYPWANPLAATDDGLADETVLTMTTGALRGPFGEMDSEDGEEVVLMQTSKFVVGEIFPRSVWLSSDGYASPHIQTNMPYAPLGITDADGDGVEDSESFTYSEEALKRLDRFYNPNYFNTAEEIYNTHHGNLPGMRLKVLEPTEPEFIAPWEVEAHEEVSSKNVNTITDQGLTWVESQENVTDLAL